MQPRVRDESGSAVVQWPIITVVLFLMITAIIQFGVAWFATDVAKNAAHEGAAQARLFNSTARSAQTATSKALHDLGPGGVVANPSISVSRTATTVRVEVKGSVVTIVPFLHLSIDQVASGPVERYVQPTKNGGH